jgi:GT2 family glycosyltransferase
MKISIIILNFNGQTFLDKCLNSIKEQTFSDFETIFFDNLSTDESVELVKKNFPWVKLISSKENLYFARGNNEATKHAQGEYLFFLNNDTWLNPK